MYVALFSPNFYLQMFSRLP